MSGARAGDDRCGDDPFAQSRTSTATNLTSPKSAEVWRRSSVIGSWLLDLTAAALRTNPELSSFEGHVSDSGEGRWTLQAAIDEGVPAPVISAALFGRFEFARASGIRGQALIGDAIRVRRPYRETASKADP